MSSQLEQLKSMTTVVADTGDFESIKEFKPVDATTNPSLLLKALGDEKYLYLGKEAIAWAREQTSGDDLASLAADKLAVLIGAKLMESVTGYVSTEVDAHLSFDTQGTIDKARSIIDLYKSSGLDHERVLIKVAATWEGIQAARVLEQEGIKCNLTLIFSFAQARACADAKAYLISPFVGRILDWYKKNTDQTDFEGDKDPGVQSVTEIYRYFKAHGHQTIVMGASFRNIGEIQSLAGCDRLTISPDLLSELDANDAPLTQMLTDHGQTSEAEAELTENQFRWQLNEDPMATENLATGIRKFAIDQRKLEDLLLNLA